MMTGRAQERKFDLYLPHEVYDALERLAARRGASRSGLIRGLILDEVRRDLHRGARKMETADV